MPCIFPIMSRALITIMITGCITLSMRLITSAMTDESEFRMLLINVRMAFRVFTTPLRMPVATDCA